MKKRKSYRKDGVYIKNKFFLITIVLIKTVTIRDNIMKQEFVGGIMKIIMMITVCLSLIGCGKIDRVVTGWTGELTYKCSKHGIEYVQSDSGLAVSLDAKGNPVICQ